MLELELALVLVQLTEHEIQLLDLMKTLVLLLHLPGIARAWEVDLYPLISGTWQIDLYFPLLLYRKFQRS